MSKRIISSGTPAYRYALLGIRQITVSFGTRTMVWLCPASLHKYCRVKGSTDRKQSCLEFVGEAEGEQAQHVPLPVLIIWRGSLKQILPPHNSAGNAERHSRKIQQPSVTTHTHRRIRLLLNRHPRQRLGQEVLDCICPVK